MTEKERDGRRERGVILKPTHGLEDHGIMTVWLPIDLVAGGIQGFGGLVLSDGLDDPYIADLLDTFRVQTFAQLEGQTCWALRCWGFFNDTIEGVESIATGKRFTLTDFCRTHVKGKNSERDPLRERTRSLESTIAWAERRANEARAELETVREGYVDWSKPGARI